MPVTNENNSDEREIDSLASDMKENLSLTAVGPKRNRSKSNSSYCYYQAKHHPYRRRTETKTTRKVLKAAAADDNYDTFQELLNKGRLIREAVNRLRLEATLVGEDVCVLQDD